MDENYVTLVNKAQKNIKLQEKNTILVELHGEKEALLRQLKILEQIATKYKAASFEIFTTDEACARLWGCRKGIRLAFYNIAPNTGILSAEAGVPLKYVPDFIKKVKQLQKEFDVQMLNHGHVGDGNFHAWALYDLHDKSSLERAKAVNDSLTKFAISVGGTATGEHGLGIDKRKFLSLEHPTSLPIMRNIKHMLDPKGILNPGKIFPD
jgi:D-lactate dehydrogenase (cytochrome)